MTEEQTTPAEVSQQKSESTEKTTNSSTLKLESFYGVKAGMTRIFDENGNHVPVSVVKLIPNYVSQVKTVAKDGYEAYQLAYGEKREKLVNKSLKVKLEKAGVKLALTRYAEVKIEGASEDNLGKLVGLDIFQPSTFIDVTGTSKGKGFQGVIKRYNFSGGPAAHGSKFHRTTGSIGNRATPGKVFKNKKMPGRMGGKKQTVQNLQVVEINEEKGYLLIKGAIPGSKNGFVKISKAVKK